MRPRAPRSERSVRVVLDTNTVVSGLLWAGPPREVIALIEQEKIILCTSPALIAELHDVIGRPKFSSRLERVQQSPHEVAERYVEHAAIIVEPQEVPEIVTSDPDDDLVLACALSAAADYIISGDRHLLDLKNYQDIPILSAADFLTAYQATRVSGE